MLEIVLLYFLSKHVGKIAITKGLKPTTWKIYLVVGWIFSELTGLMIGFLIFGQKNIFSAILVGLAFAFGSYYSLRAMLLKFPDRIDDDIDKIGEQPDE